MPVNFDYFCDFIDIFVDEPARARGRMQGGGDIHSALGILPDKLKTELAIHVNLKTLKKQLRVFQQRDPHLKQGKSPKQNTSVVPIKSNRGGEGTGPPSQIHHVTNVAFSPAAAHITAPPIDRSSGGEESLPDSKLVFAENKKGCNRISFELYNDDSHLGEHLQGVSTRIPPRLGTEDEGLHLHARGPRLQEGRAFLVRLKMSRVAIYWSYLMYPAKEGNIDYTESLVEACVKRNSSTLMRVWKQADQRGLNNSKNWQWMCRKVTSARGDGYLIHMAMNNRIASFRQLAEHHDSRIRVRRYADECCLPVCINERHSVRTPRHMIWGVSLEQQNNAHPHVARNARYFLPAKHMQLLPWFAYSPDMSPIGNEWDLVGRRLARDPHPDASKDELLSVHTSNMGLSSTSKHSTYVWLHAVSYSSTPWSG
ncbi:transposable element Tc1 transposase [Trichonephila clavipes]|uniref:Transposable element Tc1 transposase n=1 Tax=Trichonephila clavipes TaxID=2585209 RepID=A0A8X6RXP2_TRICX|nr:transposable element Tc1 transposase [Trichonephila clavipes]